MLRQVEFLRPRLEVRTVHLPQVLHHGRDDVFRLRGLRKLVGIGIEISFQRVRLDSQRRDERPVPHQPHQLVAIRQFLLGDDLGNLRHGQAFGNRKRMKHDLAAEEFRENFSGSHPRVQLVLARANFPVRRLGSPEEHKSRTALNQLLAFEQRRNLLKRRPVGNRDDLGGRVLRRRGDGLFSPFDRLIHGHGARGGRDQQKNEYGPQLHESCLP